jgi:hypothetical protein
MSGKIINLTRARKSRARDEARRQADQNAARHGRSKADRAAEADQARKDAQHLDQHRREEEDR